MDHLPLPLGILDTYRHKDPHLRIYPDHVIETSARHARHTASLWLHPRRQPHKRLPREDKGVILLGLHLLREQWLLVVYAEGAAYLYDTEAGGHSKLNRGRLGRSGPLLRASLTVEATIWASHAVSFDQAKHRLFVSFSRSHAPYFVQLYEVDILSLSQKSIIIPNAFALLRTISSPSNRIVRTLDATSQLLVTSNSNLVEIVKWDDNVDGLRRFIIQVRPEDLEDLWNGVVSAQFMGPYILIFKTRSLELHEYTPFSDDAESSDELMSSSPMTLKESFAMTFRDVSFSHCSVTHNVATDTDVYETSLLAYDVIHGLFQYDVTLTVPTSALPPVLDVQLKGVYPLALGASNLFIPAPPRVEPLTTPFLITYSSNFSPSPTPLSVSTQFLRNTHGSGVSTPTPLTQFAAESASRGFVSAHRMGPQGKRAVWIERKRSSTAREVQVWSREPPSATGNMSEVSGKPLAMEIERRVVFSLHSYDLRDDITSCAFGELNGNIFLGHRSGDVSVLPLS
ncbi:hypothetical protein NLJ89_g1533 [Agrocybe chaxingu]|uniref:Uncharacterized protein n=1 Tax=Agrocybe chaxingu TaxID=84603 RepID=A0A9W8MZW9_9AGAR|nr:hypothetical protein NLJ89_g1533 [Agrocybe chaxingu]